MPDRPQNPDSTASGAFHDARRFERRRPLDLLCTLGEVADLSPVGMRVRCMGKCIVLAGQFVDLKLEPSGGPLAVRGRIRWVKKLGFHRYDVGVEFVDLSGETASLLDNLAWVRPSGDLDADEAA